MSGDSTTLINRNDVEQLVKSLMQSELDQFRQQIQQEIPNVVRQAVTPLENSVNQLQNTVRQYMSQQANPPQAGNAPYTLLPIVIPIYSGANLPAPAVNLTVQPTTLQLTPQQVYDQTYRAFGQGLSDSLDKPVITIYDYANGKFKNLCLRELIV